MLIDGNALVHRGFHAIPALTSKSGEQTNAVYGFTMILLRAIKDLKPTHIACSFDLAGPTFRHDSYAEYKGTRVKAAQELYDQFPRVKEVARLLNIPIFEVKGFEADDVLGTLATELCKQSQDNCDVMIVTGDLDALQLVNKCVKIYTLRKGIGDTAIYDEQAVKDRYGLTPLQMIDYKSLRGDPSDNIKGVRGIGEKTAGQLIQDFGSLQKLYAAIKAGKIGDKIKPRILQLLIDGEKEADQSYFLSKIVCDVPLDIDIQPYQFKQADLTATMKLFQELEFRSLIDKLPKDYIGAKELPAVEASAEIKAKSKGTAKSATKDEGAVDAPLVPQAVKLVDFKQDYQLLDSLEKLDKVLKKITKSTDKNTDLAIDTETTGLNPIVARLVGVSLATKPGEAYYVPANIVTKSEALKKLIASNAAKIGHNIKYDLLVLQNENIKLENPAFDTMIASYLLNAGTRKHSLDAAAFNELGYQMQPIEDLIGKGKNQITMDQVDVEKVSWYAAEDADITLRLKEIFEPELKKEGLDKIFREIEMPLIPVLANMERWGIKLDIDLVARLSEDAKNQINDLEQDIYKLADEEFNLNSPKQLGEILYNKLGLTSGKKNKTGLSTAAGVLEYLLGEHPIIEKILNYRELSKLQSTYLLALPLQVNPATGRIHTSYNQTIAATGRLSSIDPNLQNIPVRGTGLGAEIRKAFVAEKGYKLVSIDYSQMELRIIAHLSQDKNMMHVFKNKEDIHANTARAIFGVGDEGLTDDMRRDAKTINFGVLYGLSSFGLSSRIGAVTNAEAKEFINKYFAAYPQVKQYIDSVKVDVNRDALVKNELGRTRKFPEVKSSQFFIRAAAERAAVNFPIQSLQADVLKIAMLNIFREIAGLGDEIRMLLQVHDELVFEVQESAVDKWIEIIKPLMESAIKLTVPVTAEAKVGDNWGQMKRVEQNSP